jgi:hypothetical protein
VTEIPSPSWTILVPTIGERRLSFERLMGALLPQTEPFGGAVKVMAWYNNGDPHLTEIRQRMNQDADTDYVSCIDDDDLVPDYFVAETMAALADRPDYVGWLVQCYSDGVPTAISEHSLKHTRWWNEETRYFRDVSHINPIRRDIALLADFRKTKHGQPEDRSWVQQLRRTRRLQRQVMINRVMYHYLFSTAKTAGIGSRWAAPKTIHPGLDRLEIEHPHFAYHPESFNG